MKTNILKTIILTSITGAAMLAHGGAVPVASSNAVQPDFPKIILQPEDQMAGFGSNAVFTVTASNTDSYQWLRNGNPLDDQTNASLVVSNCSISDVGYYSCNLYKGMETVPTRSASLMVYTNSTDPQTGVDPVVVFSLPLSSSGGTGTCPGHYAGYVNYTKTVANGWGWAPDTTNGNTSFIASDTNRPDTKIQYAGKYGDNGCDQTGVAVPSPAISPVYRFTIYFTNNVPTNAYAITLDGFKP
jgi:Immunoglobulin domain